MVDYVGKYEFTGAQGNVPITQKWSLSSNVKVKVVLRAPKITEIVVTSTISFF